MCLQHYRGESQAHLAGLRSLTAPGGRLDAPLQAAGHLYMGAQGAA